MYRVTKQHALLNLQKIVSHFELMLYFCADCSQAGKHDLCVSASILMAIFRWILVNQLLFSSYLHVLRMRTFDDK